MKSLSQIADEIAVARTSDGSFRFNGMVSLSDAVNRLEPLMADLAPVYHAACLQALRSRLGIDPGAAVPGRQAA